MDPIGGIAAGRPPEGIQRRRRAEPQNAGEQPQHAEARRRERGAPPPARPGFLPFLAKAFTAFLAVSAAYRVGSAPRQFAANPGQEVLGAALFCTPVTPADVEAGRQAFAKAFKDHIPGGSLPCIEAQARVDHLPIGVGGMHNRGEITINRNLLPPGEPGRTVAHELLHACASDDYRRAIERRGQHMARAIDEGLTEVLLERCLPNRNGFARLLAAMGLDSGYSHVKLANGDDWVTAGRKLVHEVGLPTVLEAYLGGKPDAIKKLMLAARDTHPAYGRGWTA